MRKNFLLVLSFFIFSNVLAKDIDLVNPCTDENISMDNALSNKSILLNNSVGLSNAEMFLISYLDHNGDVCYDKKYDLIFKVGSNYIYAKKLFDGLNDIYPEISSADGKFIIDFEYGNGQSNLERYYFNVRSDEVYLIKKDIVYSRTGRSKVIKFKDLNIKDVEFSKLINVY